jgi:hypothetical protein
MGNLLLGILLDVLGRLGNPPAVPNGGAEKRVIPIARSHRRSGIDAVRARRALAEFLIHFRSWTLMFAWPLLRTLPVHDFSPGLLMATS